MDAGSGWDAESYEHVSKVQREWGLNLMRSREWGGSEVVLDAGCGPGNLTRILAGTVTHGKIYAVDNDPGMASSAERNLEGYKNVEVICADMSKVRLPTPVDVVFSNAAIHWVLDHRALFANFRALLVKGGELLLQFGGRGNLESALAIADQVKLSKYFGPHFERWKPPWKFPGPQETSDMLAELGFRDVVTRLSAETPTFSTKQEFTDYLRTVILRPYLQNLASEDKARFVHEFLDAYAKCQNELTLDYVRLTVTAKK